MHVCSAVASSEICKGLKAAPQFLCVTILGNEEDLAALNKPVHVGQRKLSMRICPMLPRGINVTGSIFTILRADAILSLVRPTGRLPRRFRLSEAIN